MPRSAWVLALCLGCGARTGLDALDVDARPPPDVTGDASTDAPRPPPDCGIAVPYGTVRFRVAGVSGPAAVSPDGTIYAPYATPRRGRGLVAIDGCGRELWRRPSVEPTASGAIQGGEARLSTTGEALLTDLYGDAAARGIWRYDPFGNAVAPFPIRDILTDFVGLPAGLGPVVVTQRTGSTEAWLEGYDASGARLFQQGGWSNVNECAIGASVVACLDGAYDTRARRLLWNTPFEILDGTLRHALPPAIDGDRIYSAFFGLSSYVLVAKDLRTGRVLWRTDLARSTRGQVDLLMGSPVVGSNGTIYVYASIHRDRGPDGQLWALRRDGTLAWSFAAPSTRTDYRRHATHALGDAGELYLATGNTLYALGEDGVMRWRLTVPEGINAAAPRVSPTGDVLIHTDDDQLIAVATASRGLARTAWPVSGGDARNANAR